MANIGSLTCTEPLFAPPPQFSVARSSGSNGNADCSAHSVCLPKLSLGRDGLKYAPLKETLGLGHRFASMFHISPCRDVQSRVILCENSQLHVCFSGRFSS